MSVSKRGQNGMFYMSFTVRGKRIYRSTGKFTKKEAKIVEAAERVKIISGAATTPQQISARLLLQDAIEKTYDSRWVQNKDGIGTYKRAQLLLSHMGHIPLSSIDDDSVSVLIRKLEATGVSSSTVNRYLATLKTIMKHHRLQADFIKLRKEKNGRLRVISKEEETIAVNLLREALVNGKKSYYTEAADLIEVLVDTGMRLSELLNLKYDDVNFTSNLISIWFNKSDKPRSLCMTRRVREILEERQYINKAKPFTISIHEAERAWQWIRSEMGLGGDKEFCIHTLRHTCASRLVNAGIDLYVIKEWLGHSSIQITERYAHLSPTKLSEAVKALELD